MITNQQLTEIKAWFDAYAEGFIAGSDGVRHLHELKRDHSARVAGLARDMAAELAWPGEDVRAAEAAGWLHDVGRFSQLSEFKTLLDSKSVNHAERSCQVIDRGGVLAGLGEADRGLILAAIRAHNKPRLPPGLDPRLLRVARILRDADKIDILEIMGEAVRTGRITEQPELILHITLKIEAVEPQLIAQVKRRESGSYSHMKSLGDFLFVLLSWVYDFNYVPALRRVAAGRTLHFILERLPRTPEVDEVLGQVMADLEKAIA